MIYERSRLLVDPRVQWTIAARLLIHWASFFACVIAISTMVRLMFLPGNAGFVDSLSDSLSTQMPILIVMLMLLPVFLRDSLKLSNRFAGPMYRLRTTLRSMAQKQPVGPIKFRDGDFWMEAATDFNVVLQQVDQLKAENESLKSKLAESETVEAI